MAISLYRNAITSLYYKVRDLMVSNGFGVNDFTVMVGYPNKTKISTINIWPTITIEGDSFYGRDVELGSAQWGTVHFYIDVLARSEGQKQDISYFLWNGLNDQIIPIYDGNTGFSTVVSNYTGISQIGSASLENLSISEIVPDDSTNIIGEQFHAMIDGILNLPSN